MNLVPRFGADGTMFHCTNKSLLMSILEALPTNQAPDMTNTQYSGDDVNCSHRVRADIVDSMAKIQSLKTDGV